MTSQRREEWLGAVLSLGRASGHLPGARDAGLRLTERAEGEDANVHEKVLAAEALGETVDRRGLCGGRCAI